MIHILMPVHAPFEQLELGLPHEKKLELPKEIVDGNSIARQLREKFLAADGLPALHQILLIAPTWASDVPDKMSWVEGGGNFVNQWDTLSHKLSLHRLYDSLLVYRMAMFLESDNLDAFRPESFLSLEQVREEHYAQLCGLLGEIMKTYPNEQSRCSELQEECVRLGRKDMYDKLIKCLYPRIALPNMRELEVA